MLFSSRSGQRSIAPVTNARDNTPAAPGPLTAPVSTTSQHSAFRQNQPLSLCQPTSISAREECGEADSAKVTTALFQASPGARGMKVGWWGLWSRWKSGEERGNTAVRTVSPLLADPSLCPSSRTVPNRFGGVCGVSLAGAFIGYEGWKDETHD